MKGDSGEVLEIEYFVKKYVTISSGQNKKVQKYTLYTINKNIAKAAN